MTEIRRRRQAENKFRPNPTNNSNRKFISNYANLLKILLITSIIIISSFIYHQKFYSSQNERLRNDLPNALIEDIYNEVK